jgi:hypothetical protein
MAMSSNCRLKNSYIDGIGDKIHDSKENGKVQIVHTYGKLM